MAIGIAALGLKSLFGGKKPPKPGEKVKAPAQAIPSPAQTAPASEPVAVPKAPKVKRVTVSSPLLKKTSITSIDKSLQNISKSLGNIKGSVQTDIKFKKEKQEGIEKAAVKKRRTRRERETERGGILSGMFGGIKSGAKGGFDWIKNFLLTIVVGSIALFLIKNIEKVIQFVKDVRDKIEEVIGWVDKIILKPVWNMGKALIGPIYKIIKEDMGLIPDYKEEENEILKLLNDLSLQIPIIGDLSKSIQSEIKNMRDGLNLESPKDPTKTPPADRPDYTPDGRTPPTGTPPQENNPFRNTNEAGVYTGDRSQPTTDSETTNNTGAGTNSQTAVYGTKEQKALLNTIAFAEGTTKSGYSTWLGYQQHGPADLTGLTIDQVHELQGTFLSSGKGNFGSAGQRSAAVGRYQFVPLRSHTIAFKRNPATQKFTPEFQDQLALFLAKGRGVTQKVLERQGMNGSTIKMLSPEWASFPGNNYGQPTKKENSLSNTYNSNLKASPTPPALRPSYKQPSQTGAAVAVKNEYSGVSDKNIIMSSPYGMRTHPITGQYKMHTGIDIAPPGTGYDVGLKVSGTVTRVDNNPGGYGLFIIITSQQTGMSYMFAHMGKIYLKNGQQYNAGAPIGEIGNTGGSTGIHLHYEVYKGGATGPTVDPTPYVNLLTIGKETTTNTNRNVAKLTQPQTNRTTGLDRSASYDTQRGRDVVIMHTPPPQPTGAAAMVSGGAPASTGGGSGGNPYTYLKSWVKNKLYKQ